MIKPTKKLAKNWKSVIVTASLLAFLIVLYTVFNLLSNAGVFAPETEQNKNEIEILEGEGVYNNMPVVYPYVSKSRIVSIAVRNDSDSFVISRPETKDGYDSYFMFYYSDENGDLNVYYPPIMDEGMTDYTDFYAIESSDQLRATKLEYVCAAIGALYFDSRIEPEEDREAQLARYGLTPGEREVIYFTYIDANGEMKETSIFIGDKRITGIGYYYMIEGRDYIYTSSASDTLGYLLTDFESFLHSRITPPGLPEDGLYEPYLTTDYKQWINRYYGIASGGEGMYPSDGSEVVVFADITDTIYNSESSEGDGYIRTGYDTISLDFNKLALRPELSALVKLLKSTPVGDYSDNERIASVITNMNEAKMGVKYTYEIYAVESVITDDVEYTDEGRAVADSDYVKVTYNYRIDGETQSTEPCHAIIDLSGGSAIPDEAIDALRQKKVGDKFTGSDMISFDLVYSEENAKMRSVELIITGINLIFKVNEDESITYLDKITKDCSITYSYKYIVDGKDVGEEGREMVDLSKVTNEDFLKAVESLVGLGVGDGLNIRVSEGKVYCQSFMDFLTYSIKTVKGFLQKEMVVSFEFLNGSERDPFYAESIYKNTLENENKYYALDALACQNVTFLLGGVGATSNSQYSEGLSGSETVAVGLTPANLDRFGLYDGYTVYFELPRMIAGIKGTDDYTYIDTLGTYLYISKLNSDGTRYVASTLYDVIVKIEGHQFDFLEKSFEEYWCRKNLVMVDHKDLDRLILDLNMSDVYGKYEFDLDHDLIYISGNEHYDEPPNEDAEEYNFVTVTTRPLSENMSDTVFSAILANEGRNSITLANLYNRVAGKPVAVGHDTAGTANFKSILTLMYGTNYDGVVLSEDAEEAFENSPRIMTLTLYLTTSTYGYTYDFYRISDRRVMVHIYRVDKNGNAVDSTPEELSGFYISTFGAKKIANAFVSLLNGETVDPDAPYWP